MTGAEHSPGRSTVDVIEAAVAGGVVYAAGRDAPATVTELNLDRRDVLARF